MYFRRFHEAPIALYSITGITDLVIHPCEIFDGIQRSLMHFAVVLPSFIRIQVQAVGSPDTISLSSAPYIKYVSEKPVLHVVPSTPSFLFPFDTS